MKSYLSVSKGNMYDFVTHTYNPIGARCYHACSYCYMNDVYSRFNYDVPLNPTIREEYLNANFGSGKFIFVGSSCDMFADNVPSEMIRRVLDKLALNNVSVTGEFLNNYLLQSKNPARMLEFVEHNAFKASVICTTIETNRYYPEIMNNAPRIEERVNAMSQLAQMGVKTYVTCEPLIDFDIDEMVDCIMRCNPAQVNIGKNTSRTVAVPEPSKDKVHELVRVLTDAGIKVKIKSNAKIWF